MNRQAQAGAVGGAEQPFDRPLAGVQNFGCQRAAFGQRIRQQLPARIVRADRAASERQRERRGIGGQRHGAEVDDGDPRAERAGRRQAARSEGDRRFALVAGRRGEARQAAPRGENPLGERQRDGRELQTEAERRGDQRRPGQDFQIASTTEVDPRGPRLGGEPRDPLAAVGARRAKVRRQKSHASTQDSALIRISTLL